MILNHRQHKEQTLTPFPEKMVIEMAGINFLKMAGLPDKLSDVFPEGETVKQILTTEEQTVLSKLGLEATGKGVVLYVETKMDWIIQNEDSLTDEQKAVLTNLINSAAERIDTEL